MSYALARLRAHFDDPLLVQQGKRMVPTRLARSLAGPVRQAVADLETVFRGASAFDPATSRQTFHIASTDNLELLVLPRLSQLLGAEAPGVDIRVFPLLEDWRSGLRGGELDLKLGRSYDPGPGLVSEELLDEQLVAVMRAEHPIKARRLSVTQYARLLHIRIATSPGMQDTTSDLIDAQLAARGLSRRVALTVPHFLVAPFVVASTDLVLTAPRRLIEVFRTPLPIRTATPALLKTDYMLSQVWSAHRTDEPALAWLRGSVRRCLAQA
jgi:DNA-binding transcriptional LysR family regulator